MRQLLKYSLLLSVLSGLTACSHNLDLYSGLPADYDRNDEDFDGVINARDVCPGTVLRAEVDNYGCSREQIYTDGYELMVFFEHDSATVVERYQQQLGVLAEYLERYPEVEIAVEAHTSLSGTNDYNLALSQRRAENIKRELVERYQVAEKRIELLPLGESQPLNDEELAQSETANRRARVFVQQEYRKVVPRWNVYDFGQF
ncbi:OmpA family protein [Aliagarivorans marinus]|uniref:OmpA family protein n=1 Tax=Aliagarivorans marinus TaxID=561965 RepID=UPI000427C08D|nr:OmpA family protein [Aliagarivorans marinus]